jgi:hypothetical protein
MCRHVGFEVTRKSTVFRIVTPCSSETARRFGETFLIHLQGWKVSKQEVGQSVCFCWFSLRAYFSILKEVTCSSETLASIRSTRRYIPESSTLLCRHISFFQPYRLGIASWILIPSPQLVVRPSQLVRMWEWKQRTLLDPSPGNDWWRHSKLGRLYVCCSYSDVWSVYLSETVVVICS